MFTEKTDKEILAEVGQRLRAYRVRMNLSAESVAQRAELSTTTVINAEAGRNPTLGTVVRILRVLGRLEALDSFLPEPMVSPMALLKRGSRTPRKRAYRKRGPAKEE